MKTLYNYNFHDIFSLSSNVGYFDGLLHYFRSDSVARLKMGFVLDNNLRIDTKEKANTNLMFYYNDDDDSVEFSYPWIAPVRAKLTIEDDNAGYTFQCNKNYLRLSEFVAGGWELIDIFRSLLHLSLIKRGSLMVHGAVVGIEDEGIVMPSFGNTGKTMTSWMLSKRGAVFLTDEFGIIDSGLDCVGFPMDSIVSKALVKNAHLKLTKRQKASLLWRDAKSKLLSTRFASGGIKLHPNAIFQVRDKIRITRIAFIQNGIDVVREIDPNETIARLTAIQDYELNWRSNPFMIAWAYFHPSFSVNEISNKEEQLVKAMISQVKGSYLVSSSSGSQFELIEKIMSPHD